MCEGADQKVSVGYRLANGATQGEVNRMKSVTRMR